MIGKIDTRTSSIIKKGGLVEALIKLSWQPKGSAPPKVLENPYTRDGWTKTTSVIAPRFMVR